MAETARFFEFAYPDQATRTYVWTPNIDPVPEGSSDPVNPGIYPDPMGDGTIWSNRLRPEKESRRWRFNGLTEAKRVAFMAFLANVGGVLLKMRDPVTQPNYVAAQLFGSGLAPQWERQRGGLWGAVIEVRL